MRPLKMCQVPCNGSTPFAQEQYEFALTALVEETQSLLRGIKR